jgi:hypothetical protein
MGRIHAKAGGVFVQSVNLASDGIGLDYHRSPEPVEGWLSGWRYSREAPLMLRIAFGSDGRSRHATAAQGYGDGSWQRGPARAAVLAPQRAA